MSTHIQTLIFDRDHFTVWQAAAWAKKHGFKAKIDSTGGVLRARQHDPSPHKRYRTIPLRPGVQAVVQVTTTRQNPDVAGAILEALKANADPRFLAFLTTFEGMIREAIAEVVAETESAPAVAPEEAPAVTPKKRGRPKKGADAGDTVTVTIPPTLHTFFEVEVLDGAVGDTSGIDPEGKAAALLIQAGLSEDLSKLQIAKSDAAQVAEYLLRELNGIEEQIEEAKKLRRKDAQQAALNRLPFGQRGLNALGTVIDTLNKASRGAPPKSDAPPKPDALDILPSQDARDDYVLTTGMGPKDEQYLVTYATTLRPPLIAGRVSSLWAVDGLRTKDTKAQNLFGAAGMPLQPGPVSWRGPRNALLLALVQSDTHGLIVVPGRMLGDEVVWSSLLGVPPSLIWKLAILREGVETAQVKTADPHNHDAKLTYIWAAHDPSEGKQATQAHFPQEELFDVNLKYARLLGNYVVDKIRDPHAPELRYIFGLRPVHVEDGWSGPNDAMILGEYIGTGPGARRYWRVGRYDARAKTLWIDSEQETSGENLIRLLLIANWPVRELRQQIEELKDFPDPNHRKVMEDQGWNFLMKLADPLQYPIDPVAKSNAIQVLWHMDRMGAQIRQIVEQDRHDTQAHTKINALIDSINSAARKLGDESDYSIESTQIGEDWMKVSAGSADEGEAEEGELLARLSTYTREVDALEQELRTAYAALQAQLATAVKTGVPVLTRQQDLKLQISRVIEGAKEVHLTLQDGEGKIQELEAAGIDVTNTPEGYDWETLKAVITQAQDEGELPKLANVKDDWAVIETSILANASASILSEWVDHDAESQVDFSAAPGFLDMQQPIAIAPNPGAANQDVAIFLRRGSEISVVKDPKDIREIQRIIRYGWINGNGQQEVQKIKPAKVLGHVVDVVKKQPTSYIKGFAHTLSDSDYDELLKKAEDILDDIPSLGGNLIEFTLEYTKKEKDALIAADENLRGIEDQTEGRLHATDDLFDMLRDARDRITREERIASFIEDYLSDHKGTDWKETGWGYVWAEIFSYGLPEDEYHVVSLEDHPELGTFGVFIDDNTYWIKREAATDPGVFTLSRADTSGAVNLLDLMSETTLWDWVGEK